MAELWAKQVTVGNRTWAQVPRALRARVRALLEESGNAGLIKE